MKASELRMKQDSELRALLEEMREKLRELRADLAQGKVKNTAAIKGLRKDIARIETILREK